jgi:hypothetical protein
VNNTAFFPYTNKTIMARKLKYNDEEGGMAKAQLQKIEMYAAKLNEMIHPEDELEGWVQNKLSVVAAYMGDVKHYLDYALQNEPEYKEFANGGMMDKPRYWEVEFTWDAADEESRKVNVMAESVSDAEEQVKKKFGPYYEGLKVVEVEEDKEITWEEYSKRPKDSYALEVERVRKKYGDVPPKIIDNDYDKYEDGGMVYDIEWKDEQGDTYEASFKDIQEAKEEIRKIRDEGGRIIQTWKYRDGEYVGRFASGGEMRYEGSTEAEDFKEAEEYIGKDVWETLSKEDKLNATQYLKAKGVVGYAGQEEEIADFMASQYAKGGSLYRGFRPSPSISATAYPRGFKMIGNDGNMWEIALDSRGVHRWKRTSTASSSEKKQQDEKLYEAIQVLESVRGDVDVEDELKSLKKLYYESI